MSVSRRDHVQKILARRLQRDGNDRPVAYPSFDEAVRRIADERLHIYAGFDPTNPHLHFGHAVPLLLLSDLAEMGHRVTVLFGDFTARIGDPTDKAAARTALSESEVKRNLKTYTEQVGRIIPKKRFTVARNSKWLSRMRFDDVLALASRVTVQQMIARDMFQERMDAGKPIYVSEFLYPLMQGHDSVALDVDGEVGGNDQTFNMLVGRDLLRQTKNKDKLVLPTRLLADASGKKFSKTEGGLVSVDDKPEVIFEKVSKGIPDDAIRSVFELCTNVPLEAIAEMQRKAEGGSFREFNLALAEELVRMYHGDAEAVRAREIYNEARQGRVVADDEVVTVSGDAATPMTKLLASALGISKSEAKRLVDQGGVTRNGTLVTDALGPSGIADGDVLRVGSHRPFRVRLSR
ncbi:MAG TPA: tyrosine--tRNA ligase [Candidatus Paceibacterota bacterium]|nr:tyrosine--tRNA ligase [Candidatus Paceibacterota bacterium]